MATVQIDDDRLHVRFDRGERRWLRRTELTVPRAAIRSAAAVPQPLALARGARSGFHVTGLVKVGIWGVFTGPRQLVVARRGRPGLHLVLDRTAGVGVDEVILSVPDGPVLAAELSRARWAA
jgi:hypothetical protein